MNLLPKTILIVLDAKIRKIIIGLGGSCTNDGGAGMAQALGVKLLNLQGKDIPFGGGNLSQLIRIDNSKIDPRLKDTEIILASDVTNPLTGKNGASTVFGPQKGATPEMVKKLDQNLHHFAAIARRDLKQDYEHTPGAGAAGGRSVPELPQLRRADAGAGRRILHVPAVFQLLRLLRGRAGRGSAFGPGAA